MSGGVLFILGSGASVDSGLFTYRGCNSIKSSIVTCNDDVNTEWNKVQPLINAINEIKNNPISETYSLIQTIVDNVKNCVIMTQNVDGLIRSINGVEIVELHGTVRECLCKKCGICNIMGVTDEDKNCKSCLDIMRPNIIRIGDDLKVNVKLYLKRRYSHVVIIGTSLQFPYLRQIIGKVKCYGAKVIHINPDPQYNENVQIEKWNGFSKIYKESKNVRKGEILLNVNSSDGLRSVIDMLSLQSNR